MPIMADDDVPALLLRLRALLGGRGDVRGARVRSLTGAFERLLSHRDCHEDGDARALRELARVRAAMSSGAADVFGVVEQMDRAIEACEELMQQERRGPQHDPGAVPVSAAVRLLVALAGGDDGATFVLHDPTRVPSGDSAVLGQKRIGDKITMNNANLLSQWEALFERECLPLQEERVLPTQVMSVIGAGISSERSHLWSIASETQEPGGFLKPFDAQSSVLQGNRFMSIPSTSSPVAPPSFLNGVQQSALASRHPGENAKSLPDTFPLGKSKQSSEVFFWDGTQHIMPSAWKNHTDWDDDATSLTENSSIDGSEDFAEVSEVWSIPRSSGWESIGDRSSIPHDVFDRLPKPRGAHRGLHQLKIPNSVACRKANAALTVQVHEDDIIEGALQALSGVESVIYRRDIHTARLQLPRRHRILLPNATVSSTESLLETFREAGTFFIRLDFLGTYFSQDPRRGGKSLQVFGSALLEYLSAHQVAIRKFAEGPDRVATVTSLLTRTRKICRTLQTIGTALQCDRTDFWGLLANHEFPRGLSLLNFLHDRITETETCDSGCSEAELLRWLLKKTSSPFLSVLSDVMRDGVVDEGTDPFDEFELTRWTRELTDAVEFAGGDKLFLSKMEDGESMKMVPVFLSSVAEPITYLCRLQKVIRSLSPDSRRLGWQDLTLDFSCSKSPTANPNQEPSNTELLVKAIIATGEEIDEPMDGATETSGAQQVGEEDITPDSSRVKLPGIHPFFDATQIEPRDSSFLARAVEGGRVDNESGAILAPLKLSVDAGIIQPILLSVASLDTIARRLFLESTQFMRRVNWLRKLVFMAEGLCMDTFARDILSGLHSAMNRVHWSAGDRLTTALTLALVEARGEVSDAALHFRYQTSPKLQAMLGTAMPITLAVSQFVHDIELVYRIEWPMGVVISSQSLTHYTAIHRWLLHLRLTVLEMKEVWALLRIMGRHDGHSLPINMRQCLLEIVHQTQHLIRAFNESFCTMVLMASWTALKAEIDSSQSLLEIRDSHDRYADAVRQCCYLDEAGYEIHTAFEDVLSGAWKTSELVRALHLRPVGLTQEQDRIYALANHHSASRANLVAALQSVAHDRPRSVRAFTECLLVRVDFNS